MSMKYDPYTLHQKGLKWVKDIYVWPDAIKLLGENLWEALQDIDKGKDFSEKILEAQAIKAKTNGIVSS